VMPLDAFKTAYAIGPELQGQIVRACGLPDDQPLDDAGKRRIWVLLHEELTEWAKTACPWLTSKLFQELSPEERQLRILLPFLETYQVA